MPFTCRWLMRGIERQALFSSHQVLSKGATLCALISIAALCFKKLHLLSDLSQGPTYILDVLWFSLPPEISYRDTLISTILYSMHTIASC